MALVAVPGPLIAAEESAVGNPLKQSESWSELQGDIIGDMPPEAADGEIDLDAPYRAHDAATVPVSLRQSARSAPRIERAILVIDENPAPVAAEFTFGRAMHPLDLELRVRVNQYSNVRLIAETEGRAVMSGRFVKASGGCSAPATRDPEVALSTMGDIRVKQFTSEGPVSGGRRDAQLMIRHPNYSGLQRDQITQLFIPPHFVRQISVTQGDDLLFKLEGGISLSENPVIRFAYTDNGEKTLNIHVEDTDGNVWDKTVEKDPAR
ncbi:quinoprotein dehydrogenase-associated SoxYZ-like carrier [Rhodobacterales bacterium]|nr:quinoprotein dehydrogenase-associated SoxYZ-like carrier [Rhodobacterales bacterium]